MFFSYSGRDSLVYNFLVFFCIFIYLKSTSPFINFFLLHLLNFIYTKILGIYLPTMMVAYYSHTYLIECSIVYYFICMIWVTKKKVSFSTQKNTKFSCLNKECIVLKFVLKRTPLLVRPFHNLCALMFGRSKHNVAVLNNVVFEIQFQMIVFYIVLSTLKFHILCVCRSFFFVFSNALNSQHAVLSSSFIGLKHTNRIFYIHHPVSMFGNIC